MTTLDLTDDPIWGTPVRAEDEKVEYTDDFGTVKVAFVDSNGIPRSSEADGKRPLISLACPSSCNAGRLPGVRRGTTKKCPACKGLGRLLKKYTRATSHDVMESTIGLEKWKQRLVLTGLKRDDELQQLLVNADETDFSAISLIADQAFRVGDGFVKAQKGTDLHRLAEFVDQGWEYPEILRGDNGYTTTVSLQDRADMAAWRRAVALLELEILDIERFVVQDDLMVAGTLDRRAAWPGTPCSCKKPVIVDLKTGRMDFGGGKMTQQLSLYAHSRYYDPKTTLRSDMEVCEHVGLVINIMAGTGRATLHEVDLVKGWDYIMLNCQVREYRNACKTSIKEFTV